MCLHMPLLSKSVTIQNMSGESSMVIFSWLWRLCITGLRRHARLTQRSTMAERLVQVLSYFLLCEFRGYNYTFNAERVPDLDEQLRRLPARKFTSCQRERLHRTQEYNATRLYGNAYGLMSPESRITVPKERRIFSFPRSQTLIMVADSLLSLAKAQALALPSH